MTISRFLLLLPLPVWLSAADFWLADKPRATVEVKQHGFELLLLILLKNTQVLPPPTRRDNDRYYTVVPEVGCAGDETWLLARRSPDLYPGGYYTVRARSRDGLNAFRQDEQPVVLKGYEASNTAVLRLDDDADAGRAWRAVRKGFTSEQSLLESRRREELLCGNNSSSWGKELVPLLLLGGVSERKKRNGMRGPSGFYRGVRAFALWSSMGPAEPLFGGATLFEGGTNGCVERRKEHFNWCDFDGRLSLIFWRGEFWLFTRANTRAGYRFAQVNHSPDLQTWSNWSMVQIDTYGDPFGVPGSLYFFGVQKNPVDQGETLVALFPVARMGLKDDARSSISVAFSRDGLRWSRPRALLYSKPMQQWQRTADQPAMGLVCEGDKVHFFVQHDVPRISRNQTEIARYSSSLDEFKMLSQQALNSDLSHLHPFDK